MSDDENVVRIARAIAKSSRDADERFIGKHWDVVGEQFDLIKDQLLRQARAVLGEVEDELLLQRKHPDTERYVLMVDSTGAPTRAYAGDWFIHENATWFGKVSLVGKDYAVCALIRGPGAPEALVSYIMQKLTDPLWKRRIKLDQRPAIHPCWGP